MAARMRDGLRGGVLRLTRGGQECQAGVSASPQTMSQRRTLKARTVMFGSATTGMAIISGISYGYSALSRLGAAWSKEGCQGH